MKEPIIVSDEERISVPYLIETFDLVGRGLDVFDIQHKLSYSLTELKIGQDVHDYERLEDECNRALEYMNTHPEEVHQLHLLCCHYKGYIITDEEFRHIASTCCKYYVHAHLCKNMEDMMFKLKKICNNEYLPKYTFQRPAKTLTDCAKRFAVIKGVSERLAMTMAEAIHQDETELYSIGQYGSYIQPDLEHICSIMGDQGYKKDGSPTKLALKLYHTLQGED